MRVNTFVLFLIIASLPFNGVAEELQVVTDQLLRIQSERFEAMIDADVDALESMLSDELIYTHTTGTVETKSGILHSLRSRSINYESIEPTDVEVRVYGDTAVTTGKSKMEVSTPEQHFSLQIRFIEVYHKLGNQWQLIAYQSTRLP